MSGKVLVAIDLAHASEQKSILETGKKLADMDGSSLSVVTVIPDFGMSIVGSFFDKDTAANALKSGTEKLHGFVRDTLGSDDDVQHIIRLGTAYEEILETSKELGITLIVLGAHKPEFKDFLLGPNAARVVRHSNCSVHVVRS
jgi:universal stress protein F